MIVASFQGCNDLATTTTTSIYQESYVQNQAALMTQKPDFTDFWDVVLNNW